MNRGYVKLWRKTLDSGLSCMLIGLWAHCLLMASHDEHTVFYSGRPVTLLPGHFIFGRGSWGQKLGLSEKCLRIAMGNLQKRAMIRAITRASTFTVFEIINWDTYQCERKIEGQQKGQQVGQQKGQQRASRGPTIKNGKKLKPFSYPKSLTQNGSTAFPLHAGKSQGSPDGSPVGVEPEEPEGKPKRFTPPSLEELSAYLNARGSNIDPEAFIAYYDSKGWMIGKSKMKSWKAAVVTWEKKRAQGRGPEDTSWQTYRPWSKAYLERRKPMHKDTPRATKEEIDAGAKVVRSLITPDDYESEIVALTISWLLDDPGRCVHVKSLCNLADEVPVWGRIISWASNGARGAKVCENPWEGAE